ISGDLTRNENRIELPIMGRTQSWDNAWDVKAMSQYNTITSLSESPVKQGVIWAGTDDGFIQFTTDGGESWKSIPVTKLGIPERSFVNDIKADLYDENTVYVSLDNHKEGDLSPYLFKSSDLGESWESISNNIPDRTLVWRFVQDHVKKDLFFLATEFGIYTSINAGKNWQKLPGSPTISFRDIVIQERENDLVGASFGRGFFVLDDYSALREMTPENLSKKGKLFKPRDAKLFKPRNSLGNTGGQFYTAKNPEYGAVFTYNLNDVPKTSKSLRMQRERKLNTDNKDVPFPGYDKLANEMNEKPASIILTIKDSEGNHIRNVKKNASNGSSRIAWNLRHQSYYPVRGGRGQANSWFNPSGPYVTPGEYHAELYLENNGSVEKLDGPIAFNVKPLRKGTLEGASYSEYNSFRTRVSNLYVAMSKYQDEFNMMKSKIELLDKASLQLETFSPEIMKKISDFKAKYNAFDSETGSNPARDEIGEWDKPTISMRVQIAMQGLSTSYGPTDLNKSNLDIAERLFEKLASDVKEFKSELESLENEVKELNPPHLSGTGIN
ncbi:MAG: glycosyl hydrolase, partial [Flavobacteriaceae bacterium]|nr:glycosyl hydrolase [Flavobacteriaceae bacterium]